jgi:hypothetical protein
MNDVDDPRQLPTAEGQPVTIKAPISKRDEVAMRIQERKRLDNENLTFQPTLHARQGKQTATNVEPSGSRFDRLYGDAVKRQSGDLKQRNDENQHLLAGSALPTRLRSSSTDRRSTDSRSSFSRSSSFERMSSKENIRDATVTLPAPLKRSKSVDRSQSISASIARLHSSKDQPVEKSDERKSEKTKSGKADVAPPFLAPKVRSSSMIFIANPTAATTLSAQDRLRLLAENKNSQLETEPIRIRTRIADASVGQPRQVGQPKISPTNEVTGTATSRGRDASVKAVAGSRFDILYKDAMKRKNEDPSLRAKNLERLPFKPTITPRSRSASRDRSGGDVTDTQQRTPASRRLATPPATDNGIFRAGAPLSRSNSVDRSRGRIREEPVIQKKPQVRNSRADQQVPVQSPKVKDEIVKGRDSITVVTKPASDKDVIQNGDIKQSSLPEAPVAVVECVEKAQAQSDDEMTAVLRDALTVIIDDVAGVTSNAEPAKSSASQLVIDSTVVSQESCVIDGVESTNGHVLEVSEQTDVDDHLVNGLTIEPLPGHLESAEPFSDHRNTESTTGFKTAPFRSPGMRSRSASTDKRRWSIGSAGAVNPTGAVTIASVPTRPKDVMCDDAKIKAEENRRLKSERDSADARLKALRADRAERSASSSNVLRGGTAFAISNTQDQPVSVKTAASSTGPVTPLIVTVTETSDKLSTPARVAPSRSSPEITPTRSISSSIKNILAAAVSVPSRRNSDETPPSRPGIPSGSCA